ncbi:hypothetical protein RHS01_04178 [Rhizoctonia solani]|uniref:Uncharacterized protein n=1 Tax=Rhizoctonia solani TaxID=456999 RepID=A0A8H7M869_9AGAM|nr:hypothetical protein RHS01_04178 [Rhizoctonia solani]
MGPFLLSATAVKIGEVSLERITRLLLGLLGQVERLERELTEIKEAGIKTHTNVKNISQTIDVVKDGLKSLQPHGPRTPEDTKPLVVEATPRPYQRPTLLDQLVGSPSGLSHQEGSHPLPNQPQYKQHPRKSHLPYLSASPIPNWSSYPSPSGSRHPLPRSGQG